MGQWNINYLTISKFEQIKMCLLDDSGKPQIDVLFLNATFLTPSESDSLYEILGFTVYRRDRKVS